MPDNRLDDSFTDANRAISMMRDNEITPTPTAYEFWYRYACKSDPVLVDAIDSLIARSGRITSRTMDRLRTELYGKADDDSLSRLLDATAHQLTTMSNYVAGANGDAHQYHSNLTDSSAALQDQMDPAQLQRLVDKLMADTAQMIEKTGRLEAQLASSGNEIKTLRNELEKAKSESRTDALTGLANRKAFQSYLEAQAARAMADKKPLCVAFCDIDHFKSFNDTWGHRMGDEILRLVGHSLEHLCNGIGFPARYGGEEFVIVFPGRELIATGDVVDQVRDFISNKTVRTKQSQQSVGRVTMSFGVAQLTWEDRIEDLVERADAALYLAKRTGRNRVCLETELPKKGDGTLLQQAG
jgi:diguanylate cyclase